MIYNDKIPYEIVCRCTGKELVIYKDNKKWQKKQKNQN